MNDEEEVQIKKVNPNDVCASLKESKFRQQKLDAWRPFPTITSTLIIFVIFGLVFLALGIVIIIYSNDIIEVKKRYDDADCTTTEKDGEICTFSFEINEKMKQNVIVYYEIHNFFQNHRRYMKSRSNDQLEGEYISLEDMKDREDCKPVITNEEMGKKESLDGTPLTPSEVAIPCGLIAKSYPEERFKLSLKNGEDDFTQISIDEKNIAWGPDKEKLFKNVKVKNEPEDYYKKIQWVNMEDEHFIVWMRPSLLPNFRKLYGRIHQDLEKGTYQVTVSKPLNVKEFNGEKYFVLSTVNVFGGKNWFLSIAYIAFGGLCLLLALLFVILYNCKGSPFKEKSQ